ncbi:MAG: hypothetical protein OXC08_13625, partial [Thiotrichales bacterium]|nr:hypothetical protein [Thiotrichales bacterium]
MSAARTKPHQRALMATDSEWAQIGEAAAAAGMEKSRYGNYPHLPAPGAARARPGGGAGGGRLRACAGCGRGR